MNDLLSRGLVALESGRWRLFGALAIGFLSAICGTLFGLSTALLVLAGGVLVFGIFLFWSSLQNLAGETPLTLEEALSLGAPSAEEEQKQAVLRALKDLEYERSVGKISEDDYRELSQRYRNEAKALLLLVDRDLAPSLKKAEALLAERLGREPKAREVQAPSSGTSAEHAQAQSAQVAQSAAEPSQTTQSQAAQSQPECPQCQTQNDHDARFCKKCGHALAEATP